MIPLTTVLFATAPAHAQPRGTPQLVLEKPGPGELLEVGFELLRSADVQLESVVLTQKFGTQPAVRSWLLDAGARRTVWQPESGSGEGIRDSQLLRRFTARMTLPAGTYALYLYANSYYETGEPFQKWSHVLSDLAAMMNREQPGRDFDSYLARCFVSLGVPADQSSALRPVTRPWEREALIDMSEVGDDALLSQPARVSRDTRVHIIALGEAGSSIQIKAKGVVQVYSGTLYDYAWIEQAGSGQTVWQMTDENTEPAGGAFKNRRFDGEVRLTRGDYVFHYLTDSSHAWGNWNAAPPPDPHGWGMVVLPGAGYREGDLRPLDTLPVARDPALLVRIVQVGDNQDRRQAFVLQTRSRLHVYALGEGDDDEMFDYGRIVDLESGGVVWRMTWDNTSSGGGADKNRLFDGEIVLGPGRYEARYRTDDSHAFGSWNASPPREPHQWGMTVRLLGKSP
jgi:hypothetical protein